MLGRKIPLKVNMINPSVVAQHEVRGDALAARAEWIRNTILNNTVIKADFDGDFNAWMMNALTGRIHHTWSGYTQKRLKRDNPIAQSNPTGSNPSVRPDKSSNVDLAVAPESINMPGGIDFTPARYKLRIKRDEKGIPVPIHQQPIEIMNIQGFVPVIINFTIVPNASFLLGASKEQGDWDNVSYDRLLEGIKPHQRSEIDRYDKISNLN